MENEKKNESMEAAETAVDESAEVKNEPNVTVSDENAAAENAGSSESVSENAQTDAADSSEPSQQTSSASVFCAKCGNELQEGQEFCPKCGQKVGAKLETGEKKTEKKKSPVVFIIGGIAAVAVIIAAFFAIRGPQAKEITLNKSTLSVKAGESAEVTYVINPDNTKNKDVKWSSSNESIATVNDGKISAKNEGDCIITVTTNNGKSDTIELTVTPAGPDFNEIYNSCCDSSYASVAADGSYLSIDTNPKDSKYGNTYESKAIVAIYAVHEALGLPESVITQMGETRSIDGRQNYSNDEVEVSWTYHPDKGLEVLYTAVN